MGCDMGSVNFTGAEWLETAVTNLNTAYAHIHPYVSVVLCLAGTAMNIVTVIVLTRPSMRSAVNSLLCAIALCDILVMTSVLVFVTHFLLFAGYRCDPSDYNIYWAYFLYYHSQATVIFHATSIWLTVLLAQIRVFSIRRATSVAGESVTNKKTCFIAVSTFIVVCLLNVPNMLTFEIIETPASNWLQCKANETSDDEMLVYLVAPSDHCGLLNVSSTVSILTNFFFQIAFWTNGVLFKVVPCLLLTFSIVALVSIIRDVGKRRKQLAQVMNKKRMPRDHTTPMLVAVLSIFLFAELPQGVLHVFNAIFTKETFYDKIYIHLGDVMDVLSLLNSAVNFIIYCAMSRKFRAVFIQIFLTCLPQKIIRKYAMEAFLDGEVSRMRPTADMTKSEQLALTSHRVSASSVLLPVSRPDPPRMYSGNLLTADINGGYSHSPRVSFDIVRKESQISVVDFQLVVPSVQQESPSLVQKIIRFFRSPDELSDSPHRRIKLMQCETSTALY
ncbi:Protein CBR-DMSR-8 [Caenorhabditis briggsae]|uniref:Protein CBR-DMSR-8 n=2 Tax=Caenorhabditis briggsae TaxID=6238 RepID=A8X8M2_CAEBR|nr:Protein CBR-DMSR-8 [Caenorhabditis briggsae]CAP28983.2 Protein CBR-DMSR-8 [Caenorhabditis briggsae]